MLLLGASTSNMDMLCIGADKGFRRYSQEEERRLGHYFEELQSVTLGGMALAMEVGRVL